MAKDPTQDLTYDNVLARLLEAMPELEDLYRSHVDYYDVTLPYLFIADVARAALKWCTDLRSATITSSHLRDPLVRLMTFVEDALHSPDVYVRDLMTAGFIEALTPTDPGFGYLIESMGPVTKRWVSQTFPDSVHQEDT